MDRLNFRRISVNDNEEGSEPPTTIQIVYFVNMSKLRFLLPPVFSLFMFVSFGQTDTIYFNANWKASSKAAHDYYRVTKTSEGVIILEDYYKNGDKQMSGSILETDESLEALTNGESIDKYSVGVFKYYNQNGSIYYSVDHNPDVKKLLNSDKMKSVNIDSLKFEKTFYSNGQVKEEGLFTSEGNEHGKITRYSKDGILTYTTEYDKGVEDGETVYYYTDGTVMSSTEFKQGEKHGIEKKYKPDGQLKSEKHYVNGAKQKAKKK